MDLAARLIGQKIIVKPEIAWAFKKIDRADFLPPEVKSGAEIDQPLAIGFGQTNSQPSTVAFMLEKLAPEAGEKILDVGCGSGWTTALLAEIVGRQGRVCGLEIIPELKKQAEKNVGRYGFIKSGRATITLGDGRKGLPALAPFDRILVSAASGDLPGPLLDQLAAGGKMILPISDGRDGQSMVLIAKDRHNKIKRTIFPGFLFVPLVKPKK